jgi:hypothetical protein
VYALLCLYEDHYDYLARRMGIHHMANYELKRARENQRMDFSASAQSPYGKNRAGPPSRGLNTKFGTIKPHLLLYQPNRSQLRTLPGLSIFCGRSTTYPIYGHTAIWTWNPHYSVLRVKMACVAVSACLIYMELSEMRAQQDLAD